MRLIPVDYNAATIKGAFHLDFEDSRRALYELDAKPGDWVWLSDTEVVVGAQLEVDPVFGVVGVPRWETLTHLDDPGADDFAKVWAEYQEIGQDLGGGSEKQVRALQLLTIIEAIAPPAVRAVLTPGHLAASRAGTLSLLGEHGLALIEAEDAIKSGPNDPVNLCFYLDALGRVDIRRAASEAEARAEASDASAEVLMACISVWSAVADRLPDDQFPAVGHRILQWIDRFERAPGRGQIPTGALAQVHLFEGLILLRLGRLDEARKAVDKAHDANPGEAEIDEARSLVTFDDRARSLAERVRSKIPFPSAA